MREIGYLIFFLLLHSLYGLYHFPSAPTICLCARQHFIFMPLSTLGGNFVSPGINDRLPAVSSRIGAGRYHLSAYALLTAETVIQIAPPDLYVTWLCVTLLSVLYFTYVQ